MSPEKTKNCPYCGRELAENEMFCYYCEQDVSDTESYKNKPKEKKGFLKIIKDVFVKPKKDNKH